MPTNGRPFDKLRAGMGAAPTGNLGSAETARFKLKSPLCGTIKRQPTILKNIEEASK